MITLKTVTVRNFLSVGNATQSVKLDDQNLVLVIGENLDAETDSSSTRNGTGKSTIGNAISYALFDKAISNIKKDNLINKVNNKNMLVTLTFEHNETLYRIERGRKPNILKFYVNNVEQSLDLDAAQGDNRETQKDLTELIGMSHDMYKHIVSLNTYTEPFLSLKPSDQRPIIEQLLGVTQLSDKAELLLKEIKQSKDQIVQETANIEAVIRSNEKIQQTIDNLKLRQQAWVTQKADAIDKITNAILQLDSINITAELENHKQLQLFVEQQTRIAALKKELATLQAASIQANKSVQKYQQELLALDNDKCFACDQKLNTHKHQELHANATTQLADSILYQTEVNSGIDILTAEIQSEVLITKPVTYYVTHQEAIAHQSNLDSLIFQLDAKTAEVDPYEAQITEMTNTALQEVSWDKANELAKLKEHQDFLYKLLTNKDSFIRKKIIDQNLNYLNSRLSFYLSKMKLPHVVLFQNDLTVDITIMGQSLDFHNLSRGEMNRVIISVSLSFRDVWENLFQGVNLLFVDELIDNGLDPAGVESALGILRGIARERNKNVFLISHKEELIGRIDTVLKVTKENNFTSYDIIEVQG